MTQQNEALRMADHLESRGLLEEAAELRRLHAENEAFGIHLSERMKDLAEVEAQRDALLEALKTVEWHGQGSCWVVDADKIAAAIAKVEGNT